MPHDPLASVAVRAPAKVNLHLGVGELRQDGFHELVSVFHAVSLHDVITARRPTDGAGPILAISGAHTDGVPTDERNLAWRAALLLADAAGVAADVRLRLDKAIPVAGGMAGGSADAAATLVACSALWGVDLDLAGPAALLGSDVPFPLQGGTALGTGRGELLRPLPTDLELHWVLAFSDVGISAGDAYRELDRLRETGEAPAPVGSPDDLIAALAGGDRDAVAAGLANDLEPAAMSLQPSLAATLEAGKSAGALAGIVSGSGPTCAFLCADDADAELVGGRLRSTGRPVAVVHGPCEGAARI